MGCKIMCQSLGRLAVRQVNLHGGDDGGDSAEQARALSEPESAKDYITTYIIGFKYSIASSSISFCNKAFVSAAASRARRKATLCQSRGVPVGGGADSLSAYGRYRIATAALLDD
jgi:hypothetical protein